MTLEELVDKARLNNLQPQTKITQSWKDRLMIEDEDDGDCPEHILSFRTSES